MLNPAVEQRADEYRGQFWDAVPFPHLCIDEFLEPWAADQLLAQFPGFAGEQAINELGEVGGKAVFEALSDIGPFYKQMAAYLGSSEFAAFLSRATGIDGLLWGGENMYGGGTHENLDGIDLDPHVDFNYDDRTKLHRRLNVLLFLNREWDEGWGGSLELHADPRDPARNTVRSFLPTFNRCVIFETTERSWHGFPRIALPADKKHLSRRSLAAYFYTRERPLEAIAGAHTTLYVQRPLPSTVRPGEVLSREDYEAVRELVHKRDIMIKLYQDIHVRDGAQRDALERALAQRAAQAEELDQLLRERGAQAQALADTAEALRGEIGSLRAQLATAGGASTGGGLSGVARTARARARRVLARIASRRP
jgi:2-oxoglutarate-Fe(II)-dependent oxygenase superfamily protein